MKEINGCEPAFPCLVHNISDAPIEVRGYTVEPDGVIQFGGISKLDYFAAKATDRDVNDVMNRSAINLTRVQARYIHADAMIAEGSK